MKTSKDYHVVWATLTLWFLFTSCEPMIGPLIISIRYRQTGPWKSNEATWLVRIDHSWNSVLLFVLFYSDCNSMFVCMGVWVCVNILISTLISDWLTYLTSYVTLGKSLNLPDRQLSFLKNKRPQKMVSSDLPLFFTSQLTQSKCHIGVNRWGCPLPGVPGPGALLSQALHVHPESEGSTDPHTCNPLWFHNRTWHTEQSTAWKN